MHIQITNEDGTFAIPIQKMTEGGIRKAAAEAYNKWAYYKKIGRYAKSK